MMNSLPAQKDILTPNTEYDLHTEVMQLRQGSPDFLCGIPMSIIQKVTQISKALHLVTKHVEKNDPICESLRKASIDLLVLFYDVVSVSAHHALQLKKIEVLQHSLYGSVSFVQLAQVSGCISNQNALIIEREILKLIGQIDVFKETLSEPTENYKQVDHATINDLFVQKDVVPKKTAISDKVAEEVTHIEPSEPTAPKIVAEQKTEQKVVITQKEVVTPVLNSVKTFAPHPIVERDNDGIRRQALITKLVREKQKVTIKDIVSILPTVSEKTLQRDLTSLSEKGLVRKIGERRWAKYLAV